MKFTGEVKLLNYNNQEIPLTDIFKDEDKLKQDIIKSTSVDDIIDALYYDAKELANGWKISTETSDSITLYNLRGGWDAYFLQIEKVSSRFPYDDVELINELKSRGYDVTELLNQWNRN